ncbi:MAG: L,D-transpeptidase [Gammaproteobacteria bacterium]|jgi:hypothetical protein
MKDIKKIFSKYSKKISNKEFLIYVNLINQSITLYKNFEKIKVYKISSSKYGEGGQEGSNKTPLGAHYIKEYIGENEEIFTIFKNRKPTKNKTKAIKSEACSKEDIISSRILWLEGLENGKNKGEGVDSYSRYIYIHGTNEEGLLGKKASHGCIRMSNSDIIEMSKMDVCNSIVYISNNK